MAQTLLLCAAATAAAAGLQDPPVLGDAGNAVYLDGDLWTASSSRNPATPVAATVPGDLVSDLERAGLVGDPLFGTNWRDQAGVYAGANWTYTRSFTVAGPAAPSTLLVLDGVKMAADVYLNGVYLGEATDQHLRYTFDVTHALLQDAANTLAITFPDPAADARNDEGRFMACSGGWDWSQYSVTSTPGGLPTLSLGIWKSVYLVPSAAARLDGMTALVHYGGTYPTAPLADAAAGPWTVNVTVFVTAGPAGLPAGAVLSAVGSWAPDAPPATASTTAPLAPGAAAALTATLAVPAGAVSLWWPNGVAAPRGAPQPLYDVTASLAARAGAPAPLFSDARRVGFRCLALVTDDDTDPARLAGLTGSGALTTRLRVNGASIWARGSNVIPLDEYAARADADALEGQLRSAADAGMNALLIWGGGIWQYEAFYAAADALGLLLYHDLMYSAEGQAAHMVQATPTQRAEVTHQVRRLASHASVAVWAGGNEIGGGALYASFALAAAAEVDASRPVWPASPSSGWATGVDRLWGRPNGSPLGVRLAAPPADPNASTQQEVYYMGFQGAVVHAISIDDCGAQCGATAGCTVANYQGGGGGGTCAMRGFGFPVAAWGVPWCAAAWPPATAPRPLPLPPLACRVETHGPYTGGEGWPAVNSGNSTSVSPFNPNVPPALPPPPGVPSGPALPGLFTSEFGCTSFSSFESMAPTLAPADWGVHSPPHYWRSYSQDSIIVSHFGAAAVNLSAVGDAAAYSRQLLLSQLAAMLHVKAEIESQRATNTFGTLTWQLGEVWPTGGWGSLEYAHARASTAGQVLGGRWKPLHYAFEAALFGDLIMACGSAGQCYARNDGPMAAFNGTARLTLVSVVTGVARPAGAAAVRVSLPAGPAAMQWFCASDGAPAGPCAPWSAVLASAGCRDDASDCLLNATLVDAATGAVAAANTVLLAPAAALLPALSRAPGVAAAVQQPAPPAGAPIRIALTSAQPAMFVTLSTLAQGRFSRNAVFVGGGAGAAEEVFFLPFAAAGGDQYEALQATLQVQHL